jgi:FKBP-type peptidyl-prolyl cis-trans isomerase FklB
MRYLILAAALLLLLAGTAVAADKGDLKTDKDKDSYAIGMDIGSGLKRPGVALDADLVARGLKDAYTGGKTQLTPDEAKARVAAVQQNMQQKATEEMRTMGEKNLKDGEAYLAENKKKEGVVTLPSGLQYQVLQAGTGAKPGPNDTVTVHYRGTLIDGTEFDSSYKRNQPASFPVKGVIPGWVEALQLMPAGSKWKLVIPPSLGYGARGVGPIPPNAVLVFEVELLSIGGK